jgi:hypothetical protein
VIYDTDNGPMNGQQIMDQLMYGSYRANRRLGLSPERLAGFFGEIPAAAMEAKYRAELRTVPPVADVIANAKAGVAHCADCSSAVSVGISCGCWTERDQ